MIQGRRDAVEQAADDRRLAQAAIVHRIVLQPAETDGLQTFQLGVRAIFIQVVFLFLPNGILGAPGVFHICLIVGTGNHPKERNKGYNLLHHNKP